MVLVAPGTYVENIDFKGKAITSIFAKFTTMPFCPPPIVVVAGSLELRTSGPKVQRLANLYGLAWRLIGRAFCSMLALRSVE
jgi:hypothetical protein